MPVLDVRQTIFKGDQTAINNEKLDIRRAFSVLLCLLICRTVPPPLFWRQIILQMLVEPVDRKLDRLAARFIKQMPTRVHPLKSPGDRHAHARNFACLFPLKKIIVGPLYGFPGAHPARTYSIEHGYFGGGFTPTMLITFPA